MRRSRPKEALNSYRGVLVAVIHDPLVSSSSTPWTRSSIAQRVKRSFAAADQTEGLQGAAIETQSIFQERGTGGGRTTGSGLGPSPASTCPEARGLEMGSGLGMEVEEGSVVGGTFLSLSVVETLLLWAASSMVVEEEVVVLSVSVPVLAPEMLLFLLLAEFLDSRSYSLMKMPVENIADQV
jgi:hypothetical protein